MVTTYAAKLSVWMGVGGCWCPILFSVICKMMACLALMYSVPSLASAADDIKCLRIFAVWMSPLLVGI